MFGIVIINIILFAPVKHLNRPFREGEKPRFKKIAIVNTVILFLFSSIFQYTSISVGAFLAGVIVLPIFNYKNFK
jgi:accessory gene regulator protein AgrB